MIRRAVSSDLDSIEQTYREHFSHEKKYGAYTVFQEGVYPTLLDAVKALQNDALYVYEEDGVVMESMILDGSSRMNIEKSSGQVKSRMRR